MKFNGKGKELENMDVKEIVEKVAKGVCSFVLILLLLRGFEFGFSSNWLLSIGIILGGTLFLYLWGLHETSVMMQIIGKNNRKNIKELL